MQTSPIWDSQKKINSTDPKTFFYNLTNFSRFLLILTYFYFFLFSSHTFKIVFEYPQTQKHQNTLMRLI